MHYHIPKGTFDILPYRSGGTPSWSLSERWQYIEMIARQIASHFQCGEIRTPIFECTELFNRGVGEGTDIVSKEMYTFLDKSDRSMTLRPEGTAPTMRAFIDKKLYTLGALHKLYYIGPMFRYERPQAGRYRQHHQFGVEIVGSSSPKQDVEAIDLLCLFYNRLGLSNLSVMVNSVGDQESRERYRAALEAHFSPHLASLSKESQLRFRQNILRILDSKAPEDQEFIHAAPSIHHFLSYAAEKHFSRVCELLTDLGVHWKRNSRLVRGLDYYNHTVFEVTSTHLGAQNALGGGGRYDGLISLLGGPNLPCVGFATGLERVLVAMDEQKLLIPQPAGPFVYFIGMDEDARDLLFPILSQVRHAGLPAEMDLIGKKLPQALQTADRTRTRYTVIMGSEERATQSVILKKMETRDSETISFNGLATYLVERYSEEGHL